MTTHAAGHTRLLAERLSTRTLNEPEGGQCGAPRRRRGSGWASAGAAGDPDRRIGRRAARRQPMAGTTPGRQWGPASRSAGPSHRDLPGQVAGLARQPAGTAAPRRSGVHSVAGADAAVRLGGRLEGASWAAAHCAELAGAARLPAQLHEVSSAAEGPVTPAARLGGDLRASRRSPTCGAEHD